MKVGALFSGGKDSVYALYWALNQAWDVRVLVTLAPKTSESWMFHYPNIWITKLQSESLGISHIFVETGGEEEKEIEDLERALEEAKREYEVEGIISGALASEYQRTRIERVCHRLNLKSFMPLWHKDQSMLLRDIIRAGFNVIITGVSAYGLDESWLGKSLDKSSIDELERLKKKYGIWPGGEGGEFETLVLDGPIFKRPIVIDKCEKVWEGDRGIFVIESAHLGDSKW